MGVQGVMVEGCIMGVPLGITARICIYTHNGSIPVVTGTGLKAGMVFHTHKCTILAKY